MENNFKPATENQLATLRKLNVEYPEGLTFMEASAMISEKLGNGTPKKEQQAPVVTPAVTQTTSVAMVDEKNISDKVLNSVNKLTTEQNLVLPKNYNVSNALKAAYLKLSESNLLNTDQTALAQALLNMCIQGLNPAKNQCYFINYGGKVNMMRSYFGDRCVCISTGLVKDIQANVIYEGDVVDTKYVDNQLVIDHTTKWQNMNNPIVGAYAYAVLPDGTKQYDIMTIERIKKSWAMSKNNSNNKLQSQFTDDACKRTVIRHLAKNIFNQSTDGNLVIDSYCQTTNDEYDYNKDYAESTIEGVRAKQASQNATIQVDENGEVIDKH